ncbi:MAG TPA: hypothetical protein VG013_10340 [Gemmataceae bacterium]|nr:hypothetical protein [Gemmataceae bacterium]
MKHISLDSQEDAIKRFVLSLSVDPNGSVLELNGRAVAWVMPISLDEDGDRQGVGDWTEAKNARRCSLIDKDIAGALSPEEAGELERLQRAMLRYRRQVAPLPLDDARRLHDELLAKARDRAHGG